MPTYRDPKDGSLIGTAGTQEDYDAYVKTIPNKSKGGGWLGLKTLWNSITDPFTKDKYFLKHEQQKARDISYFEDYYTGCDAVVLIGDIWVDDIVTIQYSITNNKSPIYGYMSEEFDAVAKGTVIVQGQFVIAFKEVGYIPRILDEYESRIYAPQRGGIKDRDFETLEQSVIYGSRTAEDLQKELTATSQNLAKKGLGDLVRADKFSYYDTPSGGKIDPDGFDIVVVYGESGVLRGGTIEIINNVHITSKSLAVEPSGEPIAEIYSFFGKCINKKLSDYDNYFSNSAADKSTERSTVDIPEQELDVEKPTKDIESTTLFNIPLATVMPMRISTIVANKLNVQFYATSVETKDDKHTIPVRSGDGSVVRYMTSIDSRAYSSAVGRVWDIEQTK